MLLVGPNGQGVVSTPASLCAQIVAPYPPPAAIAIASQSGNFVSSFKNYAVQTGVGMSRAVSAGNAAAVTVPDFLEYYADDDETAVALAYVEGVADGRGFFERMRGVAERKPLVLVKGGATAGGQRAAASHTGALASDDRVFDGMCRQAGVTRPRRSRRRSRRPRRSRRSRCRGGPRRGGHHRRRLGRRDGRRHRRAPGSSCSPCPTTCGPRSTRSSRPAGAATTRSTSPAPRRVTRSPRCSSSSRATTRSTPSCTSGSASSRTRRACMRTGPFYPDHGLERIVAYHERQDARFAQAAAEISDATGKPILTATELAVADPDNPGPARSARRGVSATRRRNRAVAALAHSGGTAHRSRQR